MQKLLAFGFAISNFKHNRLTKQEQSEAISRQLHIRVKDFVVFDDSGNFAFDTSYNPEDLQVNISKAIEWKLKQKSKEEKIKERTYDKEYGPDKVMIVSLTDVDRALKELMAIARERYQKAFNEEEYTVLINSKRWKLGLLFMNKEYGFPRDLIKDCNNLSEKVKVLYMKSRIIGVIKYDDPKSKRIPWGVPKIELEKFMDGTELVGTGRSASTVLGLLRVFSNI